ncbi:uncharacterized protein [Nicotiana sylvestris]|uniref:uncharacterized protein n=1 Tax=Nicotiana sylvestris TaxID=4096 RepID=UPI00388C9A13
MSIGRLAKWQILLTEFEIINVTRLAMKAQALADHLAENPVDEEYEPLRTYFPDEEVMHIDKVEQDEKPGWKLFFDGATNMKGVGIEAVLISKIGHHYPVTAQLRSYCTNNMDEYEACILSLRLAVDMGVHEVLILGDSDLLVHQIQEEWETLDLKLIPYQQCLHDLCQRFRSAYVDSLHIQVRDHHAYCNMVEEELDDEPRFHDIREYIKSRVYPVQAKADQKRTIRHLANGFFLSGGVLYKRTPDLGLLSHLIKEVCQQFKIIHQNSTSYRPKANGAIEVANKNIKKILRKMMQGSRQWHEKLPFALLGYRTTIHTLVGATPYLLVYGTEAVIPAEVEILSFEWLLKLKLMMMNGSKPD